MNTGLQHHHLPNQGDRTPNRSLWQLLRLNALQFGVAFGYATVTALATPILLSLGLPNQLFGIGWLLGPVLGCLLSPIILVGSERCRSSWGRRRPFLLAFVMGLIIGVVLYLNGSNIGVIISRDAQDRLGCIFITMLGVVIVDYCSNACDIPSKAYLVDVCSQDDMNVAINIKLIFGGLGGILGYLFVAIDWMSTSLGVALGSQLRVICLFNVAFYTLSLALTIFSIPEVPHRAKQGSHSSTLATPSSYRYCCCIHADSGIGNSGVTDAHVQSHVVNDVSGDTRNDDVVNDKAIDDESVSTNLDNEQQLLAVENGSVQWNLPQPERPIRRNKPSRRTRRDRNRHGFVSKRTMNTSEIVSHGSSNLKFFPHSEAGEDNVQGNDSEVVGPAQVSTMHGVAVDIRYDTDGDGTANDEGEPAICPVTTTVHDDVPHNVLGVVENNHADADDRLKSPYDMEPVTVKYLLKSAIFMPCILRRLMFCCNISWTAFLTMLLFFTDFMGQAVYFGDPSAAPNSASLYRYNLGVKMGCWGLGIFSFSAAITGLILTRLDKYLSLRTIYVFGQLIYAVGCGALLLTVQYPYATISLCATFGIELAVITKIPTSIIAIYHQSEKFTHPEGRLVRTMPSDLACLGGQALIAQITVSTLLAPIVHSAGTRLALVVFASFIGFISCVLSACFISYEI